MQTTREYSVKEVEKLYGCLTILGDLKLLQGFKELFYYIYLSTNTDRTINNYDTNQIDKRGIFKPTTKYLHYDSLNSVDTITNNLGVVEERFAYKPFGQRLNLDVNGNLTNKESHTNRGYTGHEHIEDSSLIHMNGRVYDSSIARFISADPHIQSPYNTQSYNRYSYTLNNPLKYTDPSGFFFKKLFKSIKKHIKTIVTIAVVAVVAFATAGAGLALASAMGLSGIASTIVAGAVGGAIAGFTGGAVGTLLHGGSLGSAFRNGLKGAAYGAIGGAFAGGIGHYFGHSASLFTPGSAGVGSAFTKAVAHGISRAGIAKARGHKVSAGFWSGFVSSFFSVGTEGYGGVAGRTTIMAIAGGTVAKHTGGKFANGAVSAAFVHLFNAEMGNTLARRNEQIRLKNMTDKDFKKEMGFKGTNDDIWISKIKLNNQIFKNSLSDLKTLTINGISIPTPKPDVSFVTKIINFFDTTSSLKFHYNCRRASSCNVYIYE
jgi:RHS repeat-associated protein